MNFRRRLDRLEGHKREPMVVFLTKYDTPTGQPETAQAVIVSGLRYAASIFRKEGESEDELHERVKMMKEQLK